MIYTVTGGATGYLFFTRQLTYDDSIWKSWSVLELPESKRSSEVCMTQFYYEKDADLAAIKGQTLAVVGYGNQGRPWALNLRDSGLNPRVCVRNDDTRAQAEQDGFATGDISEAQESDIVCILVPDDVIPQLGLERTDNQLTILASGYSYAFKRFSPAGDQAMIAPRMLGPEVRNCFVEGAGFITALGVEQDVTGTALSRTLAVAKSLGGLREGAIELTPHQEALLDLSVEQVLSPALTHVNGAFVMTMLEFGIPLEAVLTELFLSGEVERNYGLLRTEGFVAQLEHHSPASQYGQLSRRGRYNALDMAAVMKTITSHIDSGAFADEWDAEAGKGYPTLHSLKALHAGEGVQAMERDLMRQLGPGAKPNG
jgi:ketol-acid reductoisomerase